MRTHSKTARMALLCWALLFAATAHAAAASEKSLFKRSARVDVQQDAAGFTITQPVRVSAEVRADYEAAVRALEEARYEPGIALLLKAALGARGKVGLKMNLPSGALAELLEKLPSLRRPTVSNLSENGWVAVETVIDEIVVRDIIPELKRLGAEGIIEYPLNKIVP